LPADDDKSMNPALPVPGPSRDITTTTRVNADQELSASSARDVWDRDNSNSSGSLPDNLSLSQIDPDVLAALPVDLQAEIRAHFHQAAPAKPAMALPTDNKLPVSSSPAKNVAKKGGGGLRKRGRPKKTAVAKTSSAPALAASKANVKSSGEHGASENSQHSGGDKGSCHSAATKSGVGPGDRSSERPTFCGKSTIEEIRPLIKVRNVTQAVLWIRIRLALKRFVGNGSGIQVRIRIWRTLKMILSGMGSIHRGTCC
jgi:hypothetical protein